MGDLRGRLIAFDLDGTLVDSRRDLADAANELVAELGGAPLSEDAIGRMVGEGAATLVKRVLEAAGLPAEAAGDALHSDVKFGSSRKSLDRYLDIYDARLLEHTRPYPGIVEAVETARRFACVAVLTNKPLGPTMRILEGLRLPHLFDVVIGGDGPHPRKPDPTSLRALMTRAGADPSRAMLVGDSAVDLETARRASARFCVANWGFGRHTLPLDRLSEVDILVDDPTGLADAIRKWITVQP